MSRVVKANRTLQMSLSLKKNTHDDYLVTVFYF